MRDTSDISFEDLDTIMSLVDADYWEGEEVEGRFYPLFSKPNRNKIATNSLAQIKQLLDAAFHGEDPSKVDTLVSKISGMWYGSASLLFYIKNPDQYNVFLPVTVKGIKNIYPEESKSLNYRRLFHKNYPLFNKLCKKLKAEYSLKPQELDIILTVFGKKETLKDMEELPTKPVSEEVPISGHIHAEAILLEIGNLLGFETYTADPSKIFEGRRLHEISTLQNIPEILQGTKNITRVDVIWYNEDSPPSFLFEVEDKGKMRDALHRLYQARHLNVKFFIVGPAENRRIFEEYVSTAPYKSSRRLYNFRTFEDIVRLHSLIKSAEEFKKKLGII